MALQMRATVRSASRPPVLLTREASLSLKNCRTKQNSEAQRFQGRGSAPMLAPGGSAIAARPQSPRCEIDDHGAGGWASWAACAFHSSRVLRSSGHHMDSTRKPGLRRALACTPPVGIVQRNWMLLHARAQIRCYPGGDITSSRTRNRILISEPILFGPANISDCGKLY